MHPLIPIRLGLLLLILIGASCGTVSSPVPTFTPAPIEWTAPSPTATTQLPVLTTATSTPFPPSPIPIRCQGFAEAHGTVAPALIAQLQAALHEAGLQATITAGTYGETNSCGTYAPQDISYRVTLQVESLSEQAIRIGTADSVLRIVQETGKQSHAPSLHALTVVFQAAGQACGWSYFEGTWQALQGQGFVPCPAPGSPQ